MTKRILANNPELTPWFPPEVNPVHVGWYHTGKTDKCPIGDESLESEDNWWWNGKEWCVYNGCAPIYIQNRYWRGLAVKAVQP